MKNAMFGALALALAAGLASAATHTIDFDTDAAGNAIAEGTTLSNQYAAWGVNFVPNVLSGGDWATNTDMTITSTDVGGGYVASYGNILHSFNGWLSEDGDPSFGMFFDTAISDLTVRFTGEFDFISEVALFDGNGDFITAALATGDGTLSSVTFSGLSTAEAAVVLPGWFLDWVGVVDITFTTVPAPASLGLVGLAGLTMARRRR
jgi:MYXO-CTERM domain-containing protein